MTSIMVVDDDADVLTVIKMMSESRGHQVHAFRDPALALKHLMEDGCAECSIAISDIIMPRMAQLDPFYEIHG